MTDEQKAIERLTLRVASLEFNQSGPDGLNVVCVGDVLDFHQIKAALVEGGLRKALQGFKLIINGHPSPKTIARESLDALSEQ